MNILLVLSIVGKALVVESVLMLPSALVGALYQSGDVEGILLAALIVAVCGAALCVIRPKSDVLRAREGFSAVALIWVLLSFFGGLPFYIEGAIPSLVDCFFETVSGFTTTGATILTDVEVLPEGLMFWRSFTHWVGGMGVLVLSLALLPKMGGRSINLLRAESTGPAPGKLVPRIGNSAKILYKLYIGLSLMEFVTLLFCGVNVYDSLIHTFGTAGTGGFSNYALSVGQFQNPAVYVVIGTYMLLFGVNFSVYYLLITKNFSLAAKNEEMRLYFGIVLVSVAVIAINIAPIAANAVGGPIVQSYFQVASIITTTGFATMDFNVWPELSRAILVALMLLGACAGSTGGGIKIIRLSLLMKSVARDIRHTIRPRSVNLVKMDGRVVDESTLSQVQVFFFAYMLVIGLATLIVSADGFGFESNLTASLSAVSNIGPGLGVVGPMGSFAGFSPLSKLVLSFCMLVGRLEVYPMLVLFAPSIWKHN